MKAIFQYSTPSISNVQAPFLKLQLSDPFERTIIKVDALVDTGFDGELIIPLDVYEKLNLKAFEFGSDFQSIAETASGDRLTLISASGAIKIDGIDLLINATIDTHPKCKEIIIGREFLEDFNLHLFGKEKYLEIDFVEE